MSKVTAKNRKETGMAGGKFPVATKTQAISAIKLRHNGKGVSPSAVLNHVARSKWGKDKDVKAKIAAARKADADN